MGHAIRCSASLCFVMAGLGAAIHELHLIGGKAVDARNKSGHDISEFMVTADELAGIG
jgi:hypothetical protein